MHNENIINPAITDFIYNTVNEDNYVIESMELITMSNGERILRVTSEWIKLGDEITFDEQILKLLKDWWAFTLLKGNAEASTRPWEASRFLPESLTLNLKENTDKAEYSVTFDVASEALYDRNLELTAKFKLIDQAFFLTHTERETESQLIIGTKDKYLLCGSISGCAENAFLEDFCSLFDSVRDISFNINLQHEGLFYFTMTYLLLEINKTEKGLDNWTEPYEMPVDFGGQIDDLILFTRFHQNVQENEIRIIRV